MRLRTLAVLIVLPLAAVTGARAAPSAPRDVVLEVPAPVAAAARALGPDVRLYTARARPLANLAEITSPETQVATADLGLARGLMALLRAGGVPLSGGAVMIGRLSGQHYLSRAFRGSKPPRLFVLRARPDGSERKLVDEGGGVPLLLRAAGDGAAADAGGEAAAAAPAGGQARGKETGWTSFGPLRKATASKTARTRQFVDMQAKPGEQRARAGQTLLVLHIERDFGVGLGTISFLFGSGIIVEPDFTPLAVRSSAGRHNVVASYAEGPTLELIYALPASARPLELEDGSARLSLAPLLSSR